ncbi:hypothetical protein D9M69_581940 [compost metagenome]
MMPSLAWRKRGWSSISANEPRCRPAASVMPSMPASSAEAMRTFSVSFGPFIVSFSMQLMNTMPGPSLRAMVRSTCMRVASARSPRSNLTADLSSELTLYWYIACLALTNLVL